MSSFPATYLGCLSALGTLQSPFWNPMIERVEKKKLSLWKANYLPLGGRTNVIYVTPSTLPVYYMSLLECPVSMVNHIHKLQRDFLWQVKILTRNIIYWIGISLEAQKGCSFGVRPRRQMNHARLGKWLWRIGEDGDSLRKQVIIAKYGVLRNGWDIQSPTYHSSRIWRGILSVKDS